MQSFPAQIAIAHTLGVEQKQTCNLITISEAREKRTAKCNHRSAEVGKGKCLLVASTKEAHKR